MRVLSAQGRNCVAEIADRHAVSTEAATHLLDAIVAGGNRQAQFDHPELGGMGQWAQGGGQGGSRGGMIMIGEMGNPGLRATIGQLCRELAHVAQAPVNLAPAALQDDISQGAVASTVAVLATSGSTWPVRLGRPAATGSQNHLRYAIFPATCRLVIEIHGRLTVYDTQDHRIGGVAQYQGSEQGIAFTSQHGRVLPADLPIVDDAAGTPAARPSTSPGVDDGGDI